MFLLQKFEVKDRLLKIVAVDCSCFTLKLWTVLDTCGILKWMEAKWSMATKEFLLVYLTSAERQKKKMLLHSHKSKDLLLTTVIIQSPNNKFMNKIYHHLHFRVSHRSITTCQLNFKGLLLRKFLAALKFNSLNHKDLFLKSICCLLQWFCSFYATICKIVLCSLHWKLNYFDLRTSAIFSHLHP